MYLYDLTQRVGVFMSKISKNNMFGAYLSELRKTKGKTQKKFAEEVHMSESTIAHYEQGRRTPDIETLIILADYFGVNIEYLLGRSAKFKDNLSTLTEYYYEDITYLDLIATIKQFNKHDKALLYELIKLMEK